MKGKLRRKMCKYLISVALSMSMLVVSLPFSGVIAHAENNEPNVFVHGLTGFGYGELGSEIHNWGGIAQDILGELTERGYSCLEAVVSPFGSNWDHVCELYAYIQGGRVDYGAAHSQKYGHERYGRSYPGLYPEWDASHKIHLIGHSQGGQTSRLLDTILREGDAEEIAHAGQNNEEISGLFTGEKEWITSISAIATPHNGTQIAGLAKRFVNPFIYAGAFIANSNMFNLSFDFKLDQWGLKQKPKESSTAYLTRVLNSNVWLSNRDIILYDFTPSGAEEINNITNLSENVFYFSYQGSSTYKLPNRNWYPTKNMFALYTMMSSYIGKTGPLDMRENDGLVPVKSARYPLNQAHAEYTQDTAALKGIWNVAPTIQGWEHMDFIGQDFVEAKKIKKDVLTFYIAIVERNRTL